MDRIEKLKGFLVATPHDPFLRHALALEYIKSGDEANARSLFESLLARDPGYVGSYYHLAKLLERTDNPSLAMQWYEKGMQEARKAGDTHALNELRMAYEELTD